MNIEELKKELEKEMPKFVEAVDLSLTSDASVIITTVDSFETAAILHKALKYCSLKEVTVTFVANTRHKFLQFPGGIN